MTWLTKWLSQRPLNGVTRLTEYAPWTYKDSHNNGKCRRRQKLFVEVLNTMRIFYLFGDSPWYSFPVLLLICPCSQFFIWSEQYECHVNNRWMRIQMKSWSAFALPGAPSQRYWMEMHLLSPGHLKGLYGWQDSPGRKRNTPMFILFLELY